MKTQILLTLWFIPSLALAAPILAERPKLYYGHSHFLKMEDQQLKDELFYILSNSHISHDGEADEITEQQCAQQDDHCYKFKRLSYRKARQYLFGYLDLEEGPDGFELTSIYCRKRLTNDDFPNSENLGPMKIPKSTIVNTEHSWPQSKFSTQFPKSLQKTDLHALFSTLSRVNSTRGNHPFGVVTEDEPREVCDRAQMGENEDSNKKVFEPAEESKGNIARALFYFSTRYQIKIDAHQEKHLRRWHRMDPVDFAERNRHQEIYGIQYTRNPFVDYPHLVGKISDF